MYKIYCSDGSCLVTSVDTENCARQVVASVGPPARPPLTEVNLRQLHLAQADLAEPLQQQSAVKGLPLLPVSVPEVPLLPPEQRVEEGHMELDSVVLSPH